MAAPAVLKIDIVTNARGSTAAIEETDSKLGKLGTTASKAGALLKGGLLVGGVAAVALGKQAYDAASNVQQAFGALESVYGKSAESAKRWAKSAASDVGLAQSDYANLSALLGSQLTNMGRSQAEAATQSNKLIKLGADLAATYGGSVADAVEAVSSVLKGETDPIERYGVSIKQSDIAARLAADGQDKLTGNALKAATATAALGLITTQTASAHGEFAKEADTAAGQQARLAANVENLKARLGAGLLPIATEVFGFINTTAIPAGTRLAQTLGTELGPTVSRVADFVTTRLIPAARELVTWFVDKVVPPIRSAVVPILAQLKASFGGVADSLDSNSSGLSKLVKFVGNVIEVLAKLAPVVGKVIVTELKVMSATIEAVITTVSTLVNWIDTAIGKVEALARAIANSPIGKAAGAIGGALGHLGLGAGPLAGSVGRLVGRAAPVSTVGLGGLTTAALGTGGGASFGWASTSTGGPAIVDARRYYSIDASGSIDPLGTADRIADVLRRDEVRKGKAPTFAPATGWNG